MGYMVHHMIVVTTWDEALIQQAHDKACEIFQVPNHFGKHVQVTPIMQSPVNDYYTFFVPPDGSKEGWGDSDHGDSRRDQFVAWLNEQRYDDNSSPLKWAEVQYGDEERDNRVLRHDGEVIPCDPDETE
jgi:hypothetical protein